jgi:hypothetical protein
MMQPIGQIEMWKMIYEVSNYNVLDLKKIGRIENPTIFLIIKMKYQLKNSICYKSLRYIFNL